MRIKLGLSGLNTMDLIEKANHIVSMMNANPNFPTPNPSLAEIQSAVTGLSANNDLANTGSTQGKELRDASYAILQELLRLEGAYVQATSEGEGTVITSSGFEVVAPRTPIGLLGPVTDLLAAVTSFPGTVKLNWKSFGRKAKSYNIEVTQTNPADPTVVWHVIGSSTKATFKAEGLTPGQFYWFRVYGLNAAGAGEVSDPAMCVVM